jgi:hypothetical protein
MTYEEFSQFAAGLESIVTAAAVIVAAVWAYWKFVLHGEGRAHVSFSADIVFIKRQGDWWIVELLAWIENKGKVRHRIRDFRFDVAILTENDPIEEAKEYRNQVCFPHKILGGSWIPEDWPYTFVDPGVRAPYSFIARVPAQASVVLLHAWFNYMDEQGNFHRTEKIAAAPAFLLPLPTPDVSFPPAFKLPTT